MKTVTNNIIPCLYQPEMSLAIIENRKWVTRRLVKHESIDTALNYACDYSVDLWFPQTDNTGTLDFTNPVKPAYGLPGDILWVRENFIVQEVSSIHRYGEWWNHVCIDFPASYGKPTSEFRKWFWVREEYKAKVLTRKHPTKVFTSPSIFLPFECCRTFLKVTGVRIERLQDITEDQAIGEGIRPLNQSAGHLATYGQLYEDYLSTDAPFQDGLRPVDSYRSLWDSINGEGSWQTNPFVWVIEFSKTEKPTL